MKTKQLTTWIAAVAFAAIIFTGCSKEQNQPVSSTTSGSGDMAAAEITVLVDQADNDFMNATYTGGSETEDFDMTNSGLPDAYTITEATADEINSLKRDGDGAGIRKCLHALSLKEEQLAKIKRLFSAYEACKHSIIIRHHNAQKELIIKYNRMREELVKALRNGRITKQQFEAKMKELRKMFNADREALAKKGREALKGCYEKMLRGLNGVLTERQWKAFINCYKH
ncbi:MAG: hypothetical protein V4613_07285 [Bacteroidota bacterium]